MIRGNWCPTNNSLSRIPASLLAFALHGCIWLVPYGDSWFDIEGTVTDNIGQPLPNATVAIFVEGRPAGDEAATLTSSSGTFRLWQHTCPCTSAFELVVTSPGFRQHRVAYLARDSLRQRGEQIELERDRSGD